MYKLKLTLRTLEDGEGFIYDSNTQPTVRQNKRRDVQSYVVHFFIRTSEDTIKYYDVHFYIRTSEFNFGPFFYPNPSQNML